MKLAIVVLLVCASLTQAFNDWGIFKKWKDEAEEAVDSGGQVHAQRFLDEVTSTGHHMRNKERYRNKVGKVWMKFKNKARETLEKAKETIDMVEEELNSTKDVPDRARKVIKNVRQQTRGIVKSLKKIIRRGEFQISEPIEPTADPEVLPTELPEHTGEPEIIEEFTNEPEPDTEEPEPEVIEEPEPEVTEEPEPEVTEEPEPEATEMPTLFDERWILEPETTVEPPPEEVTTKDPLIKLMKVNETEEAEREIDDEEDFLDEDDDDEDDSNDSSELVPEQQEENGDGNDSDDSDGDDEDVDDHEGADENDGVVSAEVLPVPQEKENHEVVDVASIFGIEKPNIPKWLSKRQKKLEKLWQKYADKNSEKVFKKIRRLESHLLKKREE